MILRIMSHQKQSEIRLTVNIVTYTRNLQNAPQDRVCSTSEDFMTWIFPKIYFVLI